MWPKKCETPKCLNTSGASVSVTLRETNMKSIANKELAFHSTVFTPVVHNKQVWLTASELAKALEYKKADAVTQLYSRNSDEFSDAMTTTLKLRVVRKTGDVDMMVRCFSLRGAHLVAMFADTQVAKEFRRWALDVMDKEVGKSPIKRRANYNYPIETASPKGRAGANDWMTPRKMLDENNRAPDLELIEQLEKDGYDVSGVKVRVHALYEIAQEHLYAQRDLHEIRRMMSKIDGDLRNMTSERGMNVTFVGSQKGGVLGNDIKLLQR